MLDALRIVLDALRIVNSLFLTLNVSFFHTLLDWSLVLPFYSCFILVFLSPILLIVVI